MSLYLCDSVYGCGNMSAGVCRVQTRVLGVMVLELQVFVSCQSGCWGPNLGHLEKQVLQFSYVSRPDFLCFCLFVCF